MLLQPSTLHRAFIAILLATAGGVQAQLAVPPRLPDLGEVPPARRTLPINQAQAPQQQLPVVAQPTPPQQRAPAPRPAQPLQARSGLPPALQPGGQAPAPAAGQAENLVVQAARRARVRVCLNHLGNISNFLIGGNQHGVFITQHNSEPDRQLFSAVLERVDPLGVHVITLNLSPAPMGGCAIEYTQVTHWQEGCQSVATGPFADYKIRGGLVQSVTVLEREQLLHTFLLPTPNGCVSVKREVLYFES